MGKIHTHYDNLKVARLAPQEVIRAAYKALSQKYHPDKNPGDEKAARIMAILNSAYGTLSDPQRRKEHDEWIAAEEWEIEWLESTHHEEGKSRDGRAKGHAQSHEHAWAQDVPPPKGKAPPIWRNWRWWLSLLVCLLLGWLGALLMLDTSQPMPAALASAWSGLARDGARAHPDASSADGVATPPAKNEAVAIDSWAVGKPYAAEPAQAKAPEIRVLAVSQLSLKASRPACDGASQAESAALVAPNGEPWPAQSGYVDGFPIGNKGEELSLTIDNSSNAAPVFVKLYDQERRSNVRYLYILANDKLTVEQLSAGKYEVRYQAVGPGQDNCGGATRSGAALPAPAPATGDGATQNPVVSSI
ncbi:J domain-containing protein [Janthinobacterium lividum]|uniref:J domain-containing protein n=1 Tax=Janthinobacterium lividum TaxID=29581 RepID=UPI0008759AF7|nr:J domain-containing protein [Janthinobacterium lividum]MCC7715235.1 DnaJ domain-containing protein [Janthinobacterium lividum]OEZ53397.1 chaperone protein DnaJ [Janthinobacterium lividum]WQE29385.1 DnaJ domain-containing protein [Janthinobacterium lividum]STQ94862.1 Chaperone protein DnaJ [Janthinobacterium lividum]